MIIQEIFPTALGLFKIDDPFLDDELNFLLDQPTHKNLGGNSTSDDLQILKSKRLNKIKIFVERSLDDYFNKIYSPKNDVEIHITQSWCNYTKLNEYHHRHNHPNSFLSGVFYLKADKNLDQIYFLKDSYEQIQISPTDHNVWNANKLWIGVETGDLIIFPSSLSHMVGPVLHSGIRVSISFNTFLKGNLGDFSNSSGLII